MNSNLRMTVVKRRERGKSGSWTEVEPSSGLRGGEGDGSALITEIYQQNMQSHPQAGIWAWQLPARDSLPLREHRGGVVRTQDLGIWVFLGGTAVPGLWAGPDIPTLKLSLGKCLCFPFLEVGGAGRGVSHAAPQTAEGDPSSSPGCILVQRELRSAGLLRGIRRVPR